MVDTRFSVSLQIMVTLAYHAEELMNSQELATVLKTNPTFVRKLTARLTEAGLVESFRGKNGGIRLGRDAQDINLSEIYCAATAEKPMIGCPNKPTSKSCKVSCAISGILNGIISGLEGATKNYLAKQTLHDVLKNIR